MLGTRDRARRRRAARQWRSRSPLCSIGDVDPWRRWGERRRREVGRRRGSQREVEISNADFAAIEDAQASLAEQVDDVAQVHVAMAVKVAEETLLASGSRSEVDHERATARLEDA